MKHMLIKDGALYGVVPDAEIEAMAQRNAERAEAAKRRLGSVYVCAAPLYRHNPRLHLRDPRNVPSIVLRRAA